LNNTIGLRIDLIWTIPVRNMTIEGLKIFIAYEFLYVSFSL
jgi:hypothetical protein